MKAKNGVEEAGSSSCRSRMRDLAGRLAPHQARFDRLAQANRRRADLEILIAALQLELVSQNEEIRSLTTGLYDELVVDLIAGRA